MPEAAPNNRIAVEENSPRSTISLTSDTMIGGTPDPISATGKNGSPPPVEHQQDHHHPEAGMDAVTPTIEKEVVNAVEGGVSGPPQPSSGKPAVTQDVATPMTPLPQAADYSYGTATYPSNVTPRSGYYGAYNMTPEPASPATHPSVYDVSSFLQQQHNGGFHPNSPFLTSTSLSPTRTGLVHIPPPSPLFPRVNSTDSAGQPPVLPYMSPHQINGAAAYPTYNTAEEAWNAAASNERSQSTAGYPSPANTQYNFPPRRTARSYSIEEASVMLPPAALEDPGNPAYSPYGGSQASYSMQIPPAWPYGGGPPDPYSTPASPLQPRPMYRPVYNNNGYYAANSPGPPIQTTTSNKGPDGANLFIFHIPNNFTNIDMYHLFQPFGNLLSVRIMIEKETGRSRGFGFVSYDSPESAALAIKELNGYAIGNKRLKVQHKQIRRQDIADREPSQDSFGSADGYGPTPRGFNSSLPPSGPAASTMWYETGKEHPSNATDGPLSNLGSISDALPDISGNGVNVVEEERAAVA